MLNAFTPECLIWTLPKPPRRLDPFCLSRLLICAELRPRTPFSSAEKPPIAFACELKKQVRLGLVVFGECQPAISDRTSVAHGHLK
jgi:hypothetical protein